MEATIGRCSLDSFVGWLDTRALSFLLSCVSACARRDRLYLSLHRNGRASDNRQSHPQSAPPLNFMPSSQKHRAIPTLNRGRYKSM